jgi:hypothetical protein
LSAVVLEVVPEVVLEVVLAVVLAVVPEVVLGVAHPDRMPVPDPSSSMPRAALSAHDLVTAVVRGTTIGTPVDGFVV